MSLFGDHPLNEESYYYETPIYINLGWSFGNTGPGITTPEFQIFSYAMPWRGRLALTANVQCASDSGLLDYTFQWGFVSPGPTAGWHGRACNFNSQSPYTSAPLLAFWDDLSKGTVVTLNGRLIILANMTNYVQNVSALLRASRR